MTTWFNYTYGVGIQLNIGCTFNVDRVSYSVYCEFHALYIGSIYLGTVIHSNIHVVRIVLFFNFFIEDSLGTDIDLV